MSTASVAFPESLSLAQTPTPLQPLDRLSAQLGGPRIWIKRDDLTGSHLSGNKIRKLEFVLAEARKQGCDTLITCGGLQSNHCRATALLGAQLGLSVQLILRGMPEGDADGNLFLDHLCGASVACYPAREYTKNLNDLFARWKAHYQTQGQKAFCIPTGASDEIGVWGYIKCAQELRADFAQHQIRPEIIVCATGSGGTQAGLTAGAKLHDMDAQVVGMAVCDDAEYFRSKVREDLDAWQQRYQIELNLDQLSIETRDQYVGPAYGVPAPEHIEAIKLLARLEGVILDPVYTGKAFAGLIAEIESGRWANHKNIVFVHTGGIFGLFPQRQSFSF